MAATNTQSSGTHVIFGLTIGFAVWWLLARLTPLLRPRTPLPKPEPPPAPPQPLPRVAAISARKESPGVAEITARLNPRLRRMLESDAGG